MPATIPGGDQFPELAQLLAAYFHQDYMIESENFEDIIRSFAKDTNAREKRSLILDIHRFIDRYGAPGQSLQEDMDRIFYPCVIVEGWNGLTTRQWLLRVAALVAEP